MVDSIVAYFMITIIVIVNLLSSELQGGQEKSKPLPNYQKIVSNRIKVCQWD